MIVGIVTRSIFTAEYERFRLLLIEARKAEGLTQVELARRLSRPQSFVSKFERGERRLDVVEFLEVARAVGIDPLKFLRKLSAPNRPEKKAGSQ
jgi:transcriptional regulator with XRE-family HTH domain